MIYNDINIGASKGKDMVGYKADINKISILTRKVVLGTRSVFKGMAYSRPLSLAPEMIDVPGRPYRIMRDEITVGLFRKFVKNTGYEIKGFNADELVSAIGKWWETDKIAHLSLVDGRAFAKWLSEKTGRKFRIPTEEELLTAKRMVKDQLSGKKWEWTETEHEKENMFVISSIRNLLRYGDNPEVRHYFIAVRLVEDK